MRRTLCALYLTVFLARDDGGVNEKGEGTLRDAYSACMKLRAVLSIPLLVLN